MVETYPRPCFSREEQSYDRFSNLFDCALSTVRKTALLAARMIAAPFVCMAGLAVFTFEAAVLTLAALPLLIAAAPFFLMAISVTAVAGMIFSALVLPPLILLAILMR